MHGMYRSKHMPSFALGRTVMVAALASSYVTPMAPLLGNISREQYTKEHLKKKTQIEGDATSKASPAWQQSLAAAQPILLHPAHS
jgi:hypothetical protein